MTDRVVLDVEWDGNDPDQRGLVVGVTGGRVELLADPSVTKIAFTKADHRWAAEHGIEVVGPIHDLQAMAWVYDERTDLDLEFVTIHYGAQRKRKRIFRDKGKVWFECEDGTRVLIGDAPLDQLTRYNEGDLESEAELYDILLDRLERSGRITYWQEQVVPFTEVLLSMELAGLPFSVERTERERDRLVGEVTERAATLKRDADLPDEFNLGSRDQMAEFLFTREFDLRNVKVRFTKDEMSRIKAGEWPAKLPHNFEPTKIGREIVHGYIHLKGLGMTPKVMAPKCAEGHCAHEDPGDHIPSTSAKVLRVYHGENKWVQAFCEYKVLVRGLQFLETWLEVERGGRLYTHFNQTGTDTGRISSSDPVNLQQVPSRGELGKRFRGLFEPPAGRIFLHADFAQIEPRIMAHLSQDPFLLGVFERDLDLYVELGAIVLGKKDLSPAERELLKQTFLSLSYGAQPPKIRSNLAIAGFFFPKSRVVEAFDGIHEACAVFDEWKEGAIELAESLGYVETIGGHRRHISWIDEDMRWKARNQAVNSEIQGSAGDITARTMIVIHRTLPQVQLDCQVHDELLAEVDEAEATEELRAAFQAAGETGHGFVLNGVRLRFDAKYIRTWVEGK